MIDNWHQAIVLETIRNKGATTVSEIIDTIKEKSQGVISMTDQDISGVLITLETIKLVEILESRNTLRRTFNLTEGGQVVADRNRTLIGVLFNINQS